MTTSDTTTSVPDNNPGPVYATSTNFRFPQPEPYTGVRDGFLCEIWLTAMVRFFVGARITEDQRTLHAVIFLKGDAALWWDGHLLQDSAPWSSFVDAFRAAFRPAGFLDQVRNMLFDIKMTSTVSDYVARVRKYMSILCPNDMNLEARQTLEEATVACFLKGAPKDLRQVLLTYQLNNPQRTTIHDLCSVAEQFDQIWNYAALPSSSSVGSAALSYTVASATANSSSAMEIDNINLRYEINAQRRQLQHSGSKLPRLSPEERAHLQRINGCYKCRQPGHRHYECPTKIKGVNHITTEGASSARQGKAPSDRV